MKMNNCIMQTFAEKYKFYNLICQDIFLEIMIPQLK